MRAETPQELPVINPRHHHIEHDDARRLGFRQGQRSFGIVRAEEAIARPLQVTLHEAQRVQVVVHDQDLDLLRHGQSEHRGKTAGLRRLRRNGQATAAQAGELARHLQRLGRLRHWPGRAVLAFGVHLHLDPLRRSPRTHDHAPTSCRMDRRRQHVCHGLPHDGQLRRYGG